MHSTDGRGSRPWLRVVVAVVVVAAAVVVVSLVSRDGGDREASLSNSSSSTTDGRSPSTTVGEPSSTAGDPSTTSTSTAGRSPSSSATAPRSSSSTSSTPPGQRAGNLSGVWGGDHIILTLSDSGGTVEYDCAAGTIDEPLRPDSRGNFDALGWHTNQPGGPIDPSSDRQALRARYSGWTDGSRMDLTVTLTESGKQVGQFTLERGRQVNLDRCS